MKFLGNIWSVLVGSLIVTASATAQSGVFATTNQFDGLIDQNNKPQGACMLRTSRPVVGLKYGIGNVTSIEKTDASKTKTTDDLTGFSFFGIYPLPHGVHLGFAHTEKEDRAKFSFGSIDGKATLKEGQTRLSAAAALTNGLGAGLILEQNKEEIDYDILNLRDTDTTWSIIRPEFYYAGSGFDLILRYGPTMRHETYFKEAFTEIESEFALSSQVHFLSRIWHERSSETDDGNRNHFAADFGARFLYDELKSNVAAKLTLEDAFAAGPVNGSSSNIAKQTLTVDLEHHISAVHVIGGEVSVLTGEGKGSTGSGQSEKYSRSGTTFLVSYSARL